MSILIKGMKMPPNCFLCPLSVLNGERLFCEVTKDEVIRSKRMSDCPLIELPPHGRLIDADALMENAQYKGTHDIVTAWDIVAAQTVIPASTADKEGE